MVSKPPSWRSSYRTVVPDKCGERLPGSAQTGCAFPEHLGWAPFRSD